MTRHPLARLLPDAPTAGAARFGARRLAGLLGWTVIALGPTLAVALVVARPVPAPPPQATPSIDRLADGAAGWAELYVRAWLSASRDNTAAVTGFYPDGLHTKRSPNSQLPVGSTVLAVHSPAPGSWSVLVAAEVLTLAPGGARTSMLRCVQVAVHGTARPAEAATGVATGYVAAALPALVSCPAMRAPVQPDYPSQVPATGVLGQSVLGFLSAYLTGSGELARYVTPGVELRPVAPAPFTTVRLEQLRTHDRFAPGADGRPADGAVTSVLARVQGMDPSGQDSTSDYPLTLTARAGRWEVTAIDATPLTATR